MLPTNSQTASTPTALSALPSNHVPNLAHELGHADVSRVSQDITDREIVEHLLPEGVFGVIGARDKGRLVQNETVTIGDDDKGLFDGDGEHHVGKVFVRRYQYPNGVLTIKRNHNALKIHIHRGQLDQPEGLREIAKFKLRDKRFDGSAKADESPLTDWPYSNPACDVPNPRSVELSIYSRDPSQFLGDVTGDKAMQGFLFEPFSLCGSDQFLPMWRRAFDMAGDPKTTVYPGQGAPSMKGIAAHFTAAAEAKLKQMGCTRIDNLPSHWNVVDFLAKQGYTTDSPEDREALAKLRDALIDLNTKRQANGQPVLTKAQESWVVLLQNRAFHTEGVPPPEFALGGAAYPLWMNDDGGAKNIWMSRKL